MKNIRTVTYLIGGYIACQLIADIGATKLLQLGSVVIPAGTFIFAITFTLRDAIHKRLSRDWAKSAIVAAAVFNILMAMYLAGVSRLPAPPFYASAEAWTSIFAIVPAITIASIVAEVVSELIDTEVYHIWTNGKYTYMLPQWSRVLVSNTVSLPIDSLIFATLAFVLLPPIFGGQTIPLSAALALTAGQVIWKIAATIISLPLIYTVKTQRISKSLASHIE